MVIRKAVGILSKYRTVDLSAYKSIAVENVQFTGAEPENPAKTCIRASDVLNCISTGVTVSFNDRIPYKDTPVLIKTPKQLPVIPYAGITMAGVSWGISGGLAKTMAEETSVEIKIETERMAGVLSGLKAVENRVDEGEALLYALSGKLKKSLETLQSLAGDDKGLSEEAAGELAVSVRLVKSVKQVIETDICNADGFLTKNSGIIFHKIQKEIRDA